METQRPDIVVMDINMPVMNGLDALEIVRLKKNEAKIIVVTAYSKFEFAKRAISLGAEEYILKPVTEETFIQTVKKVCALLDREKKRQAQENVRSKSDYQQLLESDLMSGLLLGEAESGTQEKYLESLHFPFAGACAVTIQHNGPDVNRRAEEWSLILHTMKKFCTCFGKMIKGQMILCLVSPSDESGDLRGWIGELMDVWSRLCRRLTGIRR